MHVVCMYPWLHACAQEEVARQARWQQEVCEELLAQEQEKKRCAAAQVKACKAKALECLVDSAEAEISECETVVGELELCEAFLGAIKKRKQSLAGGGLAGVEPV